MKQILFIIHIVGTLYSCGGPVEPVDKELAYILKIENCDSLMNSPVFQKHNIFNWPNKKPKSITEAVLLLDEVTNDYTKHQYRICDGVDLYFGSGMAIRNEWVRNGEPELSEQLYVRLKLNHPDNTSGLIILYFTEFIKDGEMDVMQTIGNRMDADSLVSVKTEILRIQDELKLLKANR